jgi:hypothetical protein
MATRILCRASDCIFWENKMCISEEIIYDPDDGCLTYEILDDLVADEEEEWDDDELLADDDDDDSWDDEDDLFLDDDIDDDKWQI